MSQMEKMKLLLHILAGFTLLLTWADHWTTYLCLSQPVEGWDVTEANPLAETLFEVVGLVPGLAIDSLVTIAAIAFVLSTTRLATHLKVALLGLISLSTGYAVVSNMGAMSLLGLSLLEVR